MKIKKFQIILHHKNVLIPNMLLLFLGTNVNRKSFSPNLRGVLLFMRCMPLHRLITGWWKYPGHRHRLQLQASEPWPDGVRRSGRSPPEAVGRKLSVASREFRYKTFIKSQILWSTHWRKTLKSTQTKNKNPTTH